MYELKKNWKVIYE